MTERTINILARVERAMASDDERQDKQSSIIEEAYREASPNGQALLDRVFVALCGYSLQTILTGNDGDDDEDYLSDGDDSGDEPVREHRYNPHFCAKCNGACQMKDSD